MDACALQFNSVLGGNILIGVPVTVNACQYAVKKVINKIRNHVNASHVGRVRAMQFLFHQEESSLLIDLSHPNYHHSYILSIVIQFMKKIDVFGFFIFISFLRG